MSAANDNLPDPFERLNAKWIQNPERRFSAAQGVIEYLVLIGKINPVDGQYNWGETIDALNEFRDSHQSTQPMWRLTAQHHGEPLWLAAQRIESRRKWSWVYFIDEQEAIKIGTSVCPADRVRDMQTGNWRKLVLIGQMRGGELTEAALHEKFADLHIRGEWYRRERQILDFIAEHCDNKSEAAA